LTQAQDAPPGGQAIVLLGGAGDLAMRMLLPSLYFLEADRLLPPDLRILGVARQGLDEEGYRAMARGALAGRFKVEEAVWARFASKLDYISADMTTAEGAGALAERLGSPELQIILFAVSPTLFGAICRQLKAAGLDRAHTRLVLE